MKRHRRARRSSTHGAGAAAAALLAALSLAGCDRDQIRTYTAPVDPPRPEPVLLTAPAEAEPPALAWDVPSDWRPAADPPGFVLAAYDVGEGEAAALATVSRLGGAGGGALANINRWRTRQLGLAPVEALEDQPMVRLDLGDAGEDVAAVVDLTGDGTRIVAAIYPRQEQDETWFFKLTGPPQTVEAHKQAFIDLVLSARPTETHP